MLPETKPAGEPFKVFALWLAALFLAVLGAQLWIVWLYGSPLPLWDQWYEASFFKLWVSGHATWADYFAPHNEHRIFVPRVFDVSLIWLNGRWEPLVEMTVNSFIHAALACGLAFCLWGFFGRKNGWLVCFLLMPFFVLPYGGENATWAFDSQNYFIVIFTTLALAGLGFCKAGSWRWWIGCTAAILVLVTSAGGLFTSVAVGGVITLRAIKNRRLEKGDLISLGICMLAVALGAALSVKTEVDQPFQAHSFMQFSAAITRNLSWPFYNAPIMPCLIILPLAVLMALYFRPNFSQSRAAEFLFGLALWSVMQSVIIAYGRANYGEVVPASRYMDFFNIFVIAAVFAAVLIVQLQERHQLRHGLLAFIYIAIIFVGVCNISKIVVAGLLAPTRMSNLVAEERVQKFMATGNEADLLERPTVRPDPQITLGVLRDKDLQTILPAVCLPPASASVTGRLAPLSQWLQEYSLIILGTGLVLFIGLCSYGIARGALGLNAKNPIAVLALLISMAALGYACSKHAISRNSVEYQLQEQIVANFTMAGNLKRAAIHEQKAEALKQFAN